MLKKNEPKLQLKAAKPNELAEIRSVIRGALNAIAAAAMPIRLKRIRSTTTLFSGSTQPKIRCAVKTDPVSHFNPR